MRWVAAQAISARPLTIWSGHTSGPPVRTVPACSTHGIWQGCHLLEHRVASHNRDLAPHLIGA
jgi:hypothetical protein